MLIGISQLTKNAIEELGVIAIAGGGQDIVSNDVANGAQARTSTILNPTGSFDFRRLTYSLARTSPASKWVTPFCSGTCFATFSLWKLKNTNLPRKRDSPVLRLITRGALSSAFSAKLFLGLVVVILVREVLALMRGLRPWNGVRLWRCFWIVGVKNKAEVAIGGDCGGGSRENFGGDRWRDLWSGG
ncbi:hypothetical protein GH714_033077 [Hevea brasiliensis]|uniref:Uncharacterized protein n=1 Tax=Hevea brasiliensis TaxID=3981 RepID=A0A6A6NKU2_HEVBR|nr:hypothetical protein GH714_033077 [Hevea brasiliensis]